MTPEMLVTLLAFYAGLWLLTGYAVGRIWPR